MAWRRRQQVGPIGNPVVANAVLADVFRLRMTCKKNKSVKTNKQTKNKHTLSSLLSKRSKQLKLKKRIVFIRFEILIHLSGGLFHLTLIYLRKRT